MSWLDDMAKNLKDNAPADDVPKMYDLTKDADELTRLLRREYENATENEVVRALDYAADKIDGNKISFPDLIKIVRVKLED